MTLLRSFLCVVLLMSLTGCVNKPMDDEVAHIPPLMIAQNSDGQVTISWESEADWIYTIYYQAEKEGDWKALRSGYRLQGTGRVLTIHDRVNPRRPMRRYRVLPEKV